MSILDLTDQNVNESQDPVAMAANTEARIRIVAIKQDTDKNSNPYILPRFEIIDEPLAKEFTKFLHLPNPEMTEKKLNACKNNLRHFFAAFDVDTSGPIDLDNLIGEEGWAILGLETNEQFGEQNYVKRFVHGE